MSDIESTRERNMQSISKNTVGNLSGGVMPRDLFDTFYQRIQESAELLAMVRTETLGRQQMAIPKIGVGERLMQAQADGDGIDTFEEADTGAVEMDVVKTVIPFKLSNEAVEDTVDDIEEVLLSKFETQFAADAQDLGINGDEESDDPFEQINDGWLEIAQGADAESDRLEGDTMPVYSHADGEGEPQTVDTSLFNNAIQTVQQKYLRTDPVFIMSRRNVQQYKQSLTDRDTGLGDAVLFGDSDLTPFGYDVIGVANFPDDQALFTAPENLVWGIRRDVEIDVVDSTDDTLEEDLFAKYVVRARHDYQIEDLQAGVYIEDIEPAVAE